MGVIFGMARGRLTRRRDALDFTRRRDAEQATQKDVGMRFLPSDIWQGRGLGEGGMGAD